MDQEIQTIGILEASTYWFDKISEQPKGDLCKKFIRHLGSQFYNTMIEDYSMSYPGNNGFSLPIKDKELESDSDVRNFLSEVANYGGLYAGPHTSKKRGEKRRKWYLNPILSPHFRIPYVHTKEPMYVSVDVVREWLAKSIGGEWLKKSIGRKKNLSTKSKTKVTGKIKQLYLFSQSDKEG